MLRLQSAGLWLQMQTLVGRSTGKNSLLSWCSLLVHCESRALSLSSLSALFPFCCVFFHFFFFLSLLSLCDAAILPVTTGCSQIVNGAVRQHVDEVSVPKRFSMSLTDTLTELRQSRRQTATFSNKLSFLLWINLLIISSAQFKGSNKHDFNRWH